MKKKYIILIVFVILFAIVASGLLPLHELNPLICIISNLPELQNPEFDEKTFYGYCDFNEDDEIKLDLP